ncbi:hypothetical protein NHX12_000878, partial [Muraenolepis orangiensis]
MHGTEARCRRGCWPPQAMLLSCVLALLSVPLPVHGNSVAANVSDTAGMANHSSLLKEGAGPTHMNEVLTAVTGAGLVAVEEAGARAGRVARGGEKDEQGSGMLGETAAAPAVEDVGVAAPPQLSPDSAETELLLPSNPRREETVVAEEEKEERTEDEELLGAEPTNPPWLVAKDTAMFDLDPRLLTTTAPPPSAANPSHPDVLHVDFFDQSARGRGLDLAPPSPSSRAHELQGGDPTSWAMPDNYDYLTPYEDGVSPKGDEYTYSTTTETYDSAEDTGRSGPRAPEPGAFVPSGKAPLPEGGAGVGPSAPVDGCNVQDYIWHKGSRCQAVVTEFQVMCMGVGASALVFLLLFMIVVCFAKKLHLLKTENKKLRKRSKYRPSSEQHNDNFSLSTIAEGSHPNKTMSRYTWECKTKEESDCQ